MNALCETWEIHARINLYLFDSLTDSQLIAKAAKGRSVSAQFSHMHNVRLMWLKSAAPQLLEGLEKAEDGVDREHLRSMLVTSALAIGQLIEQNPERVKGFKPHAHAFVGYLISHESHHRGQLELTLRLVGEPVSDKVSFGLWEWGVR